MHFQNSLSEGFFLRWFTISRTLEKHSSENIYKVRYHVLNAQFMKYKIVLLLHNNNSRDLGSTPLFIHLSYILQTTQFPRYLLFCEGVIFSAHAHCWVQSLHPI